MPSPPVLPSLPSGSRSRLRVALLSLTALSSPALVLAQETPPSTLVLDEIVITAAGFEQSIKDAPASISVITSEELQKGNFTSLTDALKEVQGVVATGIANEQDIYIRGLPGQYTLILVDGKRQNTRDSRTNGSSGYEQSFIPPIAAIDRIEIVRGPMSSLYGSDAMGGRDQHHHQAGGRQLDRLGHLRGGDSGRGRVREQPPELVLRLRSADRQRAGSAGLGPQVRSGPGVDFRRSRRV